MIWLLTGAGSGLGRGIARVLAKERETLLLNDFNAESLAETALACRETGAEVHELVADVRHPTQLADAVAALAEPLRVPDVVIANAGLGGFNPGYAFSREIEERIFAVNYHGTVNTLTPFIPAMLARGHGTLVGICSLAGLRGLPNASSYCASKAAQAAFLECLRLDLGPAITVVCVHPGFLQTPMNEHDEFPMPFMVETEAAARRVLRAIRSGRSQDYFPTLLGWISRMNRLLPNWLSDRIARRVAGPRTKQAQIFSRPPPPALPGPAA